MEVRSANGERLPAEVIFERLAARCTELTDIAFEIEQLPFFTAATSATAEHIKTFQGVDYLRQALRDLALMTAALAAPATGEEPAAKNIEEIVRRLGLAESKVILRPAGTQASHIRAAQGTGDPHLF